MKKSFTTLLSASLLASFLTANAQNETIINKQILNGDFSLHNGTNFDNWTGAATIHSNLVTGGGNAAKIASVLGNRNGACTSWGSIKGKPTCFAYAKIYFATSTTLTQTVTNITSIPSSLSADVAALNQLVSAGAGSIRIDGYFNGFYLKGSVDLSTANTANGKITLPITKTANTCVECVIPENNIKIDIITSSFDDIPSNTAMPAIVVDNIKLNYPVTTLAPIISNLTVENVVPTIATINYLMESTQTPTVVVKYGLSATNLNMEVTGSVSSTELKNLQTQTTYFYQIIATNNNGETKSTVNSFVSSSELLSLAHYQFNNALTDVNGKNTFSVNNGTSFVADRNGNANSAFQIVNTGSVATIANLPYGNSKRTVSVWVKLNSFNSNGYNMIYSYGTGATSLANGGGISLNKAFHFGYNNNHEPLTTHQTNTWYHYAFVYDGATSSIYKDGLLLGTNGKIWNTTKNGDIFRLGIGIGDEKWFDGAIDDLRIFDGTLNETQIKYLAAESKVLTNLQNYENKSSIFYPNPATNQINVTGFAEVLDLQGNKILSGTDVISIEGLEKGMYLVKTSNGISKLIKE